jgi:ketose-bisphosphate aldolase
MSLNKLSNLLNQAKTNGYAVGYFEAWDMYSFEAVLEAAEEENSPVILGFGATMMNQQWLGRFGVAPLGAYGKQIADHAKVPCAFIFNEALDINHIAQSVGTGFNTVMLDSCHLPFVENVEMTRQVIKLAKPYGIEVQAELGQLPDFGDDSKGALTDPDEAVKFVEQTGVDFLAVSIGNVHLQTQGSFEVDLERLEKILAKVDVPLVIHGGSGFPDEVVSTVIQKGVSMFHYGTKMKKAFLDATIYHIEELKGQSLDYQALVGSRKESDTLLPAKNSIKEVVKKQMRLFGSSQKA